MTLVLTVNTPGTLDTAGNISNAAQLPLLLGGNLVSAGGSQGITPTTVGLLTLTPNR